MMLTRHRKCPLDPAAIPLRAALPARDATTDKRQARGMLPSRRRIQCRHPAVSFGQDDYDGLGFCHGGRT
jgi:hypothetical protein